MADIYIAEGSPLPPTAQIASQQGTYVATRLNQSSHNDFKEAPWEKHLKFSWANKGQMAFVGKKVAVLETPGKHKPFSFKGVMPWMVWKGFYFGRQFSARNRIIIAADWIRSNHTKVSLTYKFQLIWSTLQKDFFFLPKFPI